MTAADSPTKNAPAGKNKSELVKRFFIFSAVFLFAVIALTLVQSAKEEFDKTRQAPFLIIDDKDQNSIDSAKKLFIRPVKNGSLAQEINQTLLAIEEAPPCENRTETTAELKNPYEKKSEPHKIVCESVNNIWYQSFKNKSEVFDALNKAAVTLKEKELELLQTKREKSVKTEEEIKEKKELASDGLQKIKSDRSNQPYKYALLIKNTPSESPLLPAFREETANTSKTIPVTEEKLTADVDLYFQRQMTDQARKTEDIEKQIREIDKKYQSVVKSFYTTVIVKDKLNPPETKETQIVYASLEPVLDDKGTLNVFYKFAWITLTAVIVFALLYLILIPLKLIFFLTPAGEAISEHSKKFLERKETAAGAAIATVAANPIIPTLVATVAAVGIGSAAIAAANPFGNSNITPQNSDQSAIFATTNNQSQFRQNPSINANRRPDQPRGADQSQIDKLTAKVEEMQKSLDALRKWIEDKKDGEDGKDSQSGTETGTPASASEIANALAAKFSERFNTIESLIRPPNDGAFTSLLNRINDLERERIGSNEQILASDGTLFGNVNDVSGRLGEPNNSVQQPKTLFQNLEKLSNNTQSISSILQNTGSLITSMSTLSENVGSKEDDTSKDTLTGKLKQVEAQASSIQTNQLWTDGNAFSKRYKTLVSNSRYQLSKSALNALSGKIAGTKIFVTLSKLIEENKGQPFPLMTRKDLDRILKAINREEWKTHRYFIREQMLMR